MLTVDMKLVGVAWDAQQRSRLRKQTPGATYPLKTQDGGRCCIVCKLYMFGHITGDFDATPSHFRGRKKIAEAA